jgi:polyisoprenoid-binding protein YceI
MPQFDASQAECLVFTFKEGLLSAVAHDLQLEATQLQLEVDDQAQSLSLRVEASSLRVRSAMHDGQPAPQLLSASDRQKIERTIVAEVLDAARFPTIEFRSTSIQPAGEGFAVVGQLTLHGVTREVQVVTQAGAGRQVAELALQQPAFGIKPYSALLGALKLRPEVRVRLTLPWSAAAHP